MTTITILAWLTICGNLRKLRVAITIVVTKQMKYMRENDASMIKSAVESS